MSAWIKWDYSLTILKWDYSLTILKWDYSLTILKWDYSLTILKWDYSLNILKWDYSLTILKWDYSLTILKWDYSLTILKWDYSLTILKWDYSLNILKWDYSLNILKWDYSLTHRTTHQVCRSVPHCTKYLMHRSENGTLVGNLVEMTMVFFLVHVCIVTFRELVWMSYFLPAPYSPVHGGTTQLRRWLHLWLQSRVLNLPQP